MAAPKPPNLGPAIDSATSAASAATSAISSAIPSGADIGQFIREQRQNAKLSLRRLADDTGVSNPYLSQIERGLRKPSAEILQQLAKGLRISAEQLYVQAGLLEDRGTSQALEAAIVSDVTINERQKRVLLDIYASFITENRAAEGNGGEPAEGAAPASGTAKTSKKSTKKAAKRTTKKSTKKAAKAPAATPGRTRKAAAKAGKATSSATAKAKNAVSRGRSTTKASKSSKATKTAKTAKTSKSTKSSRTSAPAAPSSHASPATRSH